MGQSEAVDIDLVRGARDGLGDAMLLIDAGCVYDARTALRRAHANQRRIAHQVIADFVKTDGEGMVFRIGLREAESGRKKNKASRREGGTHPVAHGNRSSTDPKLH